MKVLKFFSRFQSEPFQQMTIPSERPCFCKRMFNLQNPRNSQINSINSYFKDLVLRDWLFWNRCYQTIISLFWKLRVIWSGTLISKFRKTLTPVFPPLFKRNTRTAVIYCQSLFNVSVTLFYILLRKV